MKVLGVDPGYDRIGVAVMEKRLGKENLLYSACITTEKSTPLPDRLHSIGAGFEALLVKHKPDAVAVETLFFNKNQKTALGVAEARGIIVYLAKKHNALVKEFGPAEVKVATTGYGRSDKKAVLDMLGRLIPNIPVNALDDEYDAIAIALTALAHHR